MIISNVLFYFYGLLYSPCNRALQKVTFKKKSELWLYKIFKGFELISVNWIFKLNKIFEELSYFQGTCWSIIRCVVAIASLWYCHWQWNCNSKNVKHMYILVSPQGFLEYEMSFDVPLLATTVQTSFTKDIYSDSIFLCATE